MGFTAGYCNNWNVKCGDAGVNCFASFVCSTKDVNACLASTGGKSNTKKGPCNYDTNEVAPAGARGNKAKGKGRLS